MLWFGPAFCKSLGLEPDSEMAKCLLLLLLVVLSSLLGLPQGKLPCSPRAQHVGGQRGTWLNGGLGF